MKREVKTECTECGGGMSAGSMVDYQAGFRFRTRNFLCRWAPRQSRPEGPTRDDDEAVYFLRGDGKAFVGSGTMDVRPGFMMFVPRGVQHGFISTGSTPLEFLWTIAPGQLAAGFRARGVPLGTPCRSPN